MVLRSSSKVQCLRTFSGYLWVEGVRLFFYG